MTIRILAIYESNEVFECLKCENFFPNEDAATDTEDPLCQRCADKVIAEAEDRMERSYE